MITRTERPRRLDWEGTQNIRDLGGYETADGRETTWDVYLRGDNLYNLTSAGQQALVDHGVRTIVDLRSPSELEIHPSPFADGLHPGITYLNLPIIDETDERTLSAMRSASTQADDYVVILENFGHKLAAVMSAIADAPEVPVLFHCHAGKDRTGMIAALLLSLANVPDETVAQDYSLTYTYLRDQFEQWKAGLTTTDPHVRARLIEGFRCRPETMLQVLDHLQRRYGGVEGYLLSLGLSRDQIERLRRRLVP